MINLKALRCNRPAMRKQMPAGWQTSGFRRNIGLSALFEKILRILLISVIPKYIT
jgi:hypothetical protein